MIVADGDRRCVGIGSGAATGWPATDWMEEICCGTTALESTTPGPAANCFSSSEVKNAAEILGELWFTEGYVLGGKDSIVSTSFDNAPAPMFGSAPLLDAQAG